MKTKKYKNLKILLPIILIIFVVLVLTMCFVLPKPITEKTYFKSVENSNYTKQIQQTSIKEDNIILYEKNETVVFDKGKIYHKIEEKVLSSSNNEDYEELTLEFYYDNNYIYYYHENEWKVENFNFKEKLQKYNFKNEYFSSINYDKEFENTGVLLAIVNDNNIQDILNKNVNYKNLNLIITINNLRKIEGLNFECQNSLNQNVIILNSYSYENEVVNLPL